MKERQVKRDLRSIQKAGEETLASLYTVRKKIRRVKKWELLNFFGGRAISSHIKKRKMNEIEVLLGEVRMQLMNFQKVLKAGNAASVCPGKVRRFLTFSEFAFVNPITDYLQQNRLQSTWEEVEDTIQLIEELLAQMERKQKQSMR